MHNLEGAGHRVLAAHDGREALELYEEHGKEIDLVLLDIDLPRLDGMSCLHSIRDRDGQQPVILTSGAAKPELEGERNVTFLPKPYDASRLRRSVSPRM